jgi:hypothetical protein
MDLQLALRDQQFRGDVVARATAWGEARERAALGAGVPLTPALMGHARALGISRPENVRIRYVPRIEPPDDPILAALNDTLGFIKGTGGICFRYGIEVWEGHQGDTELHVHELVHTQQYERYGDVKRFMAAYVEQLARHGYFDAPLEVEARRRAAELCSA